MTKSPLPDRWSDDAVWLVQAIDPIARLARLVRMTGDDYRQASFLDDRIMAGSPDARLCGLDEVLAAGKALPARDAGWIFHIGHVGSTLVSRLLGELQGTFAIREPRSLRDLMAFADTERADAAKSLGRLMARPLPGASLPVIKATSFVSEYAPLLVADGVRALFLFATPRNYIASILAGENSTKELHALAPVRAERLAARHIHLNGTDQSNAHRAAAAWLTEMVSLDHAASALGERVAWFDFDQMLRSMPEALSAVAGHLRIDATRATLSALADGPLMRRYSKAMEYEYSPRLRYDLLEDANLRYGRDIDRAMEWLGEAVTQDPKLAAAVARAQ